MIHCHCQWITDPLPEAKNITNFQNRSRHRRGNSKRKVPTQLRNGVPTHYFITFWSRRENFLGTISWHAPAKESWWLNKIFNTEKSKWWSNDKNLRSRGLLFLWSQVRVMWLLICWPLEAYMVVNFKTCGISRGACKLVRTPTLN
jgi:hypothetical protein